MGFILTGFSEEVGFRVFAFESVATGQVRIAFTVRADLALSRRYGIRLQELPLLCRGLLEQRDENEQQHSFTLTEDVMSLHATAAAARSAAAKKRKPPRRAPGEDPEAAPTPETY